MKQSRYETREKPRALSGTYKGRFEVHLDTDKTHKVPSEMDGTPVPRAIAYPNHNGKLLIQADCPAISDWREKVRGAVCHYGDQTFVVQGQYTGSGTVVLILDPIDAKEARRLVRQRQGNARKLDWISRRAAKHPNRRKAWARKARRIVRGK